MRSTAGKTYGKTASGERITDALVEELARKAEAGYETEEMTEDIDCPPSAEDMDEAIDLAIDGRSPQLVSCIETWNNTAMLKGQDVVVLLKLLGSAKPVPVRELADRLGFDVAGTHRAMRRLDDAGLYSATRRRIYPAAAEEFLIHAIKFSFPPQWRSEVRGVPTSWAAEPLKEELAEPGGLPPVWPYSKGTVRGLGLEPLHAIVPKAALADPGLWQRLALVDALRSNDSARITQLAEKLLKERIGP